MQKKSSYYLFYCLFFIIDTAISLYIIRLCNIPGTGTGSYMDMVYNNFGKNSLIRENKMQRILLITLLTIPALHLNCAGWTIPYSDINRELRAVAESIKNNRSLVYTLDQKKVGTSGYFYIMRSDGRISYHPKKGLINFSFSDYAFAKRILSERNGCVVSTADRITRYIFYCEIDKNEILCLTMDCSEVDGNLPECVSVEN